MKYTIIYWSRFGNGKKIVDSLAVKLKEKSIDTQILKTEEVDPTTMPEADLYVFSAPTEAFNVQKNMRTFMKKLEGMEDKKYALINTHGMKKSKLDKMEKLLSDKQMTMVAGVDFQVGKDAKSGDALPDGWEEKLNEFVEKL
jgi:flavodoxin